MTGLINISMETNINLMLIKMNELNRMGWRLNLPYVPHGVFSETSKQKGDDIMPESYPWGQEFFEKAWHENKSVFYLLGIRSLSTMADMPLLSVPKQERYAFQLEYWISVGFACVAVL